MKKKVIILLAMLLFSGVYAQEKVITIKYYFVEGCPYCDVVKEMIDQIEENYPNIQLIRMNVYESSLYMNEFLSYGFWKVPAVVINGKAKFQGDEEVTDQNLRGTIEDYLSSYNKGSSFFEKGKSYYEKKEYKKAKIYLEEAKNLFENGNFDTNSTEDMLEDCNSCIEAYDLIFKGDLFLENNDPEKAREMYSLVKCEDLKSTAEEKIDNIDIYEESLQSFNTAVEYYSQKNYSQALSLFKTLENILVGEKQKKCKDYIEKCKKYIEAQNLYDEGIKLIFNDNLSAQKKFIEAGIIYDSLGENSEKCNTFSEALVNFLIGETLWNSDPKSALKYFEKAEKDFKYLDFQKGVEKCEYYIKRSKKGHLIYWIFFITSLIVVISVYLLYFKKKKKDNKNAKKELKKLVDKYANGEISLEEFDKKKKKVIK